MWSSQTLSKRSLNFILFFNSFMTFHIQAILKFKTFERRVESFGENEHITFQLFKSIISSHFFFETNMIIQIKTLLHKCDTFLWTYNHEAHFVFKFIQFLSWSLYVKFPTRTVDENNSGMTILWESIHIFAIFLFKYIEENWRL